MKLLTKDETQKNVDELNNRKGAIVRDQPYVPLVIPEGMDTCSAYWLEYCLALHMYNLPTQSVRIKRMADLNLQNPGLVARIMPHLERIRRENEQPRQANH